MPHFKGFAMINFLVHTVFVATFSHFSLESVIVVTAPYFEHTAPLTYSLWIQPKGVSSVPF